jgi:hypothetical protein
MTGSGWRLFVPRSGVIYACRSTLASSSEEHARRTAHRGHTAEEWYIGRQKHLGGFAVEEQYRYRPYPSRSTRVSVPGDTLRCGLRHPLQATHLENRTQSKARVKQAEELLDMVRGNPDPVVIAGDMNTTGADGSVKTIQSAVLKKIQDPRFWATKGIKYATGVGFAMDLTTFGFKTAKFQSDPTAAGVPLVAANPEEPFLTTSRSSSSTMALESTSAAMNNYR